MPPPPGAGTNRGTMLKRSWHTPIMVDTSHRKYEHPSFIIYCFIEIFQNRDPPSGARTNRGTMLKKSWYTPTMVDTFHRKT